MFEINVWNVASGINISLESAECFCMISNLNRVHVKAVKSTQDNQSYIYR